MTSSQRSLLSKHGENDLLQNLLTFLITDLKIVMRYNDGPF